METEDENLNEFDLVELSDKELEERNLNIKQHEKEVLLQKFKANIAKNKRLLIKQTSQILGLGFLASLTIGMIGGMNIASLTSKKFLPLGVTCLAGAATIASINISGLVHALKKCKKLNGILKIRPDQIKEKSQELSQDPDFKMRSYGYVLEQIENYSNVRYIPVFEDIKDLSFDNFVERKTFETYKIVNLIESVLEK